jgi:hypothetical protein
MDSMYTHMCNGDWIGLRPWWVYTTLPLCHAHVHPRLHLASKHPQLWNASWTFNVCPIRTRRTVRLSFPTTIFHSRCRSSTTPLNIVSKHAVTIIFIECVNVWHWLSFDRYWTIQISLAMMCRWSNGISSLKIKYAHWMVRAGYRIYANSYLDPILSTP